MLRWVTTLGALVLAGCGSSSTPATDAGTQDAAGRADAGVPGDAGMPTGREAALCTAVEMFVDEHDMPGAVVATRFPDGSTHACAAGVANLADGTPLSTTDLFQIGSVTKTFTAAIVLLLAEDGLLSLNDPLSRWVPGFTASDPTLAQMLNHTSGLGEYLFDDTLQAMRGRPHTEDELLALARSKPIERMPGVRFNYSNTNYLVMGAVIEAASGRPWYELVRERLLDPLGMTDTFAWGFETRPTGSVHGYAWDGTAFVDATTAMHPTIETSAGCMVSSAADLIRWASALYGGDVLRPESLRAMANDYRVPHAYDGGVYENTFVGLANFIERDDTYGEWWGHAGGTPGFVTNMRYLVSEGRVVIVFINGVDPRPDPTPPNRLTNDAWIALLL